VGGEGRGRFFHYNPLMNPYSPCNPASTSTKPQRHTPTQLGLGADTLTPPTFAHSCVSPGVTQRPREHLQGEDDIAVRARE